MSENMNKCEEELNADSDSVSDTEDSSNADSCKKTIQQNLDDSSPINSNCLGVSQLLSRIFLKGQVNSMQLAELIIGQKDVGCLVVKSNKNNEGSDVENESTQKAIFGVTTVINLTNNKSIPCINEIFTYITERAQKHGTDNTISLLQSIFNNEQLNIGFIVNERYMNIPTNMSIPLFETLVIEIDEAIAQGKKFQFDHYMMIIKKFRDMDHLNDPSNEHFSNREEQIFEKNATASFEFCVTDECNDVIIGDWIGNNEILDVEPYQKILLIEANKLSKIVEEITELLDKED